MDAGLLAELEHARDLGFLGPGPVDAHVAHAEAFLAAVPSPPAAVLDLGAGGGVPGLVLALAWPAAQLTLLDAQERRTAFLAGAVQRLGLERRVVLVTGRAEELAHDPEHRGRYEVVTARSFGPPAVTAECGAPFLQVGGLLVVAEPPDAPPTRWPAEGVALVGLADDGVVRAGGGTVRRLQLVSEPDPALPRRVGRPAKRPLF